MNRKWTDPSDTTAERLLSTAAKLFRMKGYAGSSTRELASLLGIQSSTLYHYVKKKEDLLYEVCIDCLNRIHQEVEQAVAEQADPIERIRAMIHTHVIAALADQDKHATMLIELRELSASRRIEVLALRDAYEELVQRNLSEACTAGAIRNDVPVKYLTLALLNLLNWSIFWFNPAGELTSSQLSDYLTTVFLEGGLVRPYLPFIFDAQGHEMIDRE